MEKNYGFCGRDFEDEIIIVLSRHMLSYHQACACMCILHGARTLLVQTNLSPEHMYNTRNMYVYMCIIIPSPSMCMYIHVDCCYCDEVRNCQNISVVMSFVLVDS